MILITGSLAYDQIMDFPGKFSEHILADKIHILNVSFLVEELRKGFGGTAGNIAYTLSLLGIKTSILGIAGRDFTPYKKFLEKNGIDTSFIKIDKRYYTSSAFGITDRNDNQIWGFYTGADSLSNILSITLLKEKIDFGMIAPHNPKAMLKFAREYQKMRIPYLFDPGMQLRYFDGRDLKEGFEGAEIIIGNDYEIAIMEKKIRISNLHDHYKEKIIITTLGEKGSIVRHRGKTLKVAAAKVAKTIDPTGAGDCYRAGFTAGYLKGLDIVTCGQMGSLAAAYTVEKYGTMTHSFTTEQFRKRYKENFGGEICLS